MLVSFLILYQILKRVNGEGKGILGLVVLEIKNSDHLWLWHCGHISVRAGGITELLSSGAGSS